MKPFLENVAAHILANHPTDLADVVICFPNNRVGYFLSLIHI